MDKSDDSSKTINKIKNLFLLGETLDEEHKRRHQQRMGRNIDNSFFFNIISFSMFCIRPYARRIFLFWEIFAKKRNNC